MPGGTPRPTTPRAGQRAYMAVSDRPPRHHRHAPPRRRAPGAPPARAARRGGPGGPVDRARDARLAGGRRARASSRPSIARSSGSRTCRGWPCGRSRSASGFPREPSRAARGTPCVRCGWCWKRWGCAHDARPRGSGRLRAGRPGCRRTRSASRAHLADCPECAAAHAELPGCRSCSTSRSWPVPVRRTRCRPPSRSACWTASPASARRPSAPRGAGARGSCWAPAARSPARPSRPRC